MFRNSKCLVTGGTGLIGRHVVDLLIERGAKVTSVSLDEMKLNPKCEYWLADLTYFEQCEELVDVVDYVFHVAGIKGSGKVTQEKPASMFVVPLQMNTNVIESARLAKVKGLVFVSSIGATMVNGEPLDKFPGWVKRMGELQIEAYKIQYGMNNFHVVRPTNTYGEGDNFDPDSAMVIPSLMAKTLRGDDPVWVWGDGGEVRDFTYSGDIAEGIVLAMEHGTKGHCLELGGFSTYKLKDVVGMLESITGSRYEFHPSLGVSQKRRVVDNTLAHEIIGYTPRVSLKEGLKRTWDWFVTHKDEYILRKNYFKEV